MQFLALATDYDGTLAKDGKVDAGTVAAMERFNASGRKLILVTGRELEDLRENFDRFDLFAYIIAENGALLHDPKTKHNKRLGTPPPPDFVERLTDRGVGPISVGEVIVATWEPHENEVLHVIREMNLELQVIFNKGAVMVLPSGINKATGLRSALDELGISQHNTVGVGDAENDHSFLEFCEVSVAVSNALPSLKENASIVTLASHGTGVTELIDRILETDLRDAFTPKASDRISLGTLVESGLPLALPYRSANVMVAGASGGGKSTLVTTFLEQLLEKGYQFCLIDPEGDFDKFEGVVTIGNSKDAPRLDEVITLLRIPHQSAVINLVAVPLEDRPAVFLAILPKLLELRSQIGRPHWIIVDEAHHVLPVEWEHSALNVPARLSQMLFVTLYPRTVLSEVLKQIHLILGVGDIAGEVLTELGAALDKVPPTLPSWEPGRGKAIVWDVTSQEASVMNVTPPTSERQRHRRKYAEGNLPEGQSFYFRGKDGKLNLRAQNLITFVQLARGIDDETWQFHLGQHDYSAWFRQFIKNDELTAIIERVEDDSKIGAEESKVQMIAAIEDRYTAPAKI